MAVSEETSEEIGEEARETAMAGMVDLRNVLELVNDGLDHPAFAQKQGIVEGQRTGLHACFESCYERHAR